MILCDSYDTRMIPVILYDSYDTHDSMILIP